MIYGSFSLSFLGHIKLIQGQERTEQILNGLQSHNVISQELYDEIMSIPDSEGRMSALMDGPLKSTEGQEVFNKILKEKEPWLMMKNVRGKQYGVSALFR